MMQSLTNVRSVIDALTQIGQAVRASKGYSQAARERSDRLAPCGRAGAFTGHLPN